jgi:hypothetical protein
VLGIGSLFEHRRILVFSAVASSIGNRFPSRVNAG